MVYSAVMFCGGERERECGEAEERESGEAEERKVTVSRW
jgi:hypothetical protein